MQEVVEWFQSNFNKWLVLSILVLLAVLKFGPNWWHEWVAARTTVVDMLNQEYKRVCIELRATRRALQKANDRENEEALKRQEAEEMNAVLLEKIQKLTDERDKWRILAQKTED